MLVNLIDIWSILRPFRVVYGHLLYFVLVWYIFPVLVRCTEKYLASLTGNAESGLRQNGK
jgi:hypothetical protein